MHTVFAIVAILYLGHRCALVYSRTDKRTVDEIHPQVDALFYVFLILLLFVFFLLWALFGIHRVVGIRRLATFQPFACPELDPLPVESNTASNNLLICCFVLVSAVPFERATRDVAHV